MVSVLRHDLYEDEDSAADVERSIARDKRLSLRPGLLWSKFLGGGFPIWYGSSADKFFRRPDGSFRSWRLTPNGELPGEWSRTLARDLRGAPLLYERGT